VVCMYGQVEIKTTKETPDAGNLQKAADFVQAFILGKLQQRRSLPGSHTAQLLDVNSCLVTQPTHQTP
jgi:hypothetical protein